MSVALAQTWTSVLAAVGAAGAVGGFIVLVRPDKKSAAILAAILVLLVGLGVVGFIEKEL